MMGNSRLLPWVQIINELDTEFCSQAHLEAAGIAGIWELHSPGIQVLLSKDDGDGTESCWHQLSAKQKLAKPQIQPHLLTPGSSGPAELLWLRSMNEHRRQTQQLQRKANEALILQAKSAARS